MQLFKFSFTFKKQENSGWYKYGVLLLSKREICNQISVKDANKLNYKQCPHVNIARVPCPRFPE